MERLVMIKNVSSRLAAFASAALFALLATPLHAQQAPAGPNETKVIGDWTVRCFAAKSASPCDMFQLLADKRSGRRVLSLSIAYLPAQDKHIIQISLPLGVALAKGIVVSTNAYTSPTLHYRRCDRGGCYVEGLVDNSTVDALARSTANSQVQFTAYGGRPYELKFSLNGFAEAHNTMSDLARARINAHSK
jgi:invasion protein IalB